MKYFQKIIAIIFLLLVAFYKPSLILAQDDQKTTVLNEIVNALNNETENVYKDHYNFASKYENDKGLLPEFFNDLATRIKSWNLIVTKTKLVYEKYLSSEDQNITLIAYKALDSNKKLVEAVNYYSLALVSEDENTSNKYFNFGDTAIKEASFLHYEAVDLYNNYSGVSSSISTKNWLIFFSIVSVLFSCLLFIKSREHSQLEAEKIRSGVYRSLLSSSLWMTGGLIVTTAGYVYALKKGGTYYIFYGPIFVGGWKLFKGFYYYFTKGRKALEHLNSIQKDEAIRESYASPDKQEKKSGYVCQHCGFKYERKSVICKNCGENLL